MGIHIGKDENDLYVSAMLEKNGLIEDALAAWVNAPDDVDAMIGVCKSLCDRDGECGGLIVSVEDTGIMAGADNIEVFTGEKHLIMNRAMGEDGKGYVMVFTSKERFREYDSTAGVVMFIGELFVLLGDMEGIDGIIINIGREAVSIGRRYMQIISKILKLPK